MTVLGHLQRGGIRSAFDRSRTTRFGGAAVRLAAAGGFGRMVALQKAAIVDVPLEEALTVPRRVDVNCDAVCAARAMGICLGDI